jgi:hypothetical protein
VHRESTEAGLGDDAKIRELEARFAAVFNAKDVDAVMKAYVPGNSLIVHRRRHFRFGAPAPTCRRDAAMKVLQACADEEIHTVWTGTIKRLIHWYLEHRNKRPALRRVSAENKLVAPYEGRRWCDATERVLIGDIANGHGPHL